MARTESKHGREIGFVDLPPLVRRRIYALLGPIDHDEAPFTTPYGAEYPWGLGCFGSCWHDEPFAKLLLTCRTTYSDLIPLVYSQNHVIVDYHRFRSLRPLRYLRPSTLSSLRFLSMAFTDLSIDDPPSCTVPEVPTSNAHASADDPHLSENELRSQAIIREWHSTWDHHLRPQLNPKALRLTLSLDCSVANEEAATSLLRPFLEAPSPLLAGCYIRLSRWPNRALRSLAELAVSTITEPPPQPKPMTLSFLDLPAELRQQILSYTDLVVHDGDIFWDPESGTFLPDQRSCHYRYDDPTICGSYHSGICYCKFNHAAASSTPCKCWAPPTAPFLTCRTVRQDALLVFYGSNRFVIMPHKNFWRPVTKSPPRLHVSKWLRDVVPRIALRYLRHVKFVFPAFGWEKACTYCPLSSPERYDWMETIELTKSVLDLPNLDLSVHFAQGVIEMGPLPDYRRSMTGKDAKAVQRCYLNTIAPLKRWGLAGLGKFSVYLPNPAACGAFWEYDLRSLPLFLLGLEREAERLVMGQHYNALTAGKKPYPDTKRLRSLTNWDEDPWDHHSLPHFYHFPHYQ